MELHRDDYMAVASDGDLITLAWHREEPDDDHAVKTADAAKAAIDAHLAAHPGAPFRVLIDLTVVRKMFPRATASYATWLMGHRSRVRAGAFATRALLLRTAVSAALLVPGLTMKAFKDVDGARAYLAAA